MLYLDQNRQFTRQEFLRTLRLCFRYADCFTLTELCLRDTPLKTDLQKELRPFLIRNFEARSWFITPKMDPPCHIFLYKADTDALPVLEQYTHSLFRLDYRIPEENLEDICFFSGETLFFGTLSRDGCCGVYPPTDGFEMELLSIRDDWRRAEKAVKPLSLRHYK